MPPSFIVPDVKEISKMLGTLLGRDVKVAKGDRIRTGARDKYTLGCSSRRTKTSWASA